MSIHDSKYAKNTFYVKKSKCPIPRDISCPAPETGTSPLHKHPN